MELVLEDPSVVPISRLPEPESFWQRCVYTFWWLYAPIHPLVRDVLTKLRIVKHSGRQDFLLGKLLPGTNLRKFLAHAGKHGLANHFIAWGDDGELISLRRLDEANPRCQYHLRIFADGEVRGHYEFTPEFHPVRHLRRATFEPRREDFLKFLGKWVTPSAEILPKKSDYAAKSWIFGREYKHRARANVGARVS